MVLKRFAFLAAFFATLIAAPPALAAEAFKPLVDYHQHLASPAGVAILQAHDPMQAAVKVPAEVDSLLDRMSREWNQAGPLADLYTDKAIVFAGLREPDTPWLLGRRSVSDYIASLYGSPYRLTPVGFDVSGNSARLAGYVTRGETADPRHFGYFYFQLERAPAGGWQIAVDIRTFDRKPYYQPTIDGRQLVAKLDAAGIRQAVVLSDAYWFDAPQYRDKSASEEAVYAQVRAENDWTADEARKSHGRLVAFCSFNPLAPYAITELRRCAASGRFAGIKLHLQTSGVDLHDDDQVAKVRKVFAEADRLHMPLTVHAQTKKPYDAAAATAFIDRVVPAARHVPVIIAHLWGGGPFAREPLNIYVRAVQSRRHELRNLYFDVAEAALVAGGDKKTLSEIASAIRAIGATHILFGSDAVGEFTLAPVEAAAQFRADVPLTPSEFAQIERNDLLFLPALARRNRP